MGIFNFVEIQCAVVEKFMHEWRWFQSARNQLSQDLKTALEDNDDTFTVHLDRIGVCEVTPQ